MQTDNRLLDDLARMANGALNTLSGLREEIETRVRERVDRLLADMDLVTREEFEATREMAQTARAEQERLAAKVTELERRLGEGGASGARSTSRARQAGAAKSAKPAAGAKASSGPRKAGATSKSTTARRGGTREGSSRSPADDQGGTSG